MDFTGLKVSAKMCYFLGTPKENLFPCLFQILEAPTLQFLGPLPTSSLFNITYRTILKFPCNYLGLPA